MARPLPAGRLRRPPASPHRAHPESESALRNTPFAASRQPRWRHIAAFCSAVDRRRYLYRPLSARRCRTRWLRHDRESCRIARRIGTSTTLGATPRSSSPSPNSTPGTRCSTRCFPRRPPISEIPTAWTCARSQKPATGSAFAGFSRPHGVYCRWIRRHPPGHLQSERLGPRNVPDRREETRRTPAARNAVANGYAGRAFATPR